MAFGALIGSRFLHQRCHHVSSLEQDKLTVCCLLQTGSQEPNKGHLQSGLLKKLKDRLLLKGWAIDRTQELCAGTKQMTAASIPQPSRAIEEELVKKATSRGGATSFGHKTWPSASLIGPTSGKGGPE